VHRAVGEVADTIQFWQDDPPGSKRSESSVWVALARFAKQKVPVTNGAVKIVTHSGLGGCDASTELGSGLFHQRVAVPSAFDDAWFESSRPVSDLARRDLPEQPEAKFPQVAAGGRLAESSIHAERMYWQAAVKLICRGCLPWSAAAPAAGGADQVVGENRRPHLHGKRTLLRGAS